MQLMQPMKIVFIFLVFLIPVVFSQATVHAYCFEKAGRYYDISPTLLKAISLVESNYKPDAVHRNMDGSVDYCHMQVNSCWKKHLSYKWQYLSDPCYCTMVGAWILRQCIDRYGYNWNAVACYHTGKSPTELKLPKKRRAINYVRKVQHALSNIE